MLIRRSLTRAERYHQQFPQPSRLMTASLVLGAVGLLANLAGFLAVQVVMLVGMVLLAAATAQLAARSAVDRRERAGWTWFSLCFVFYALYFATCLPSGEPLVTELTVRNATSRILTLLAYLCCLAGLAFAVRVPRGFLARLLLDTGVVLAGGTVIVAEILQNTSITISTPDLTTRLLYRPMLDLAIISLLAIALASMPRSARLYASLVRGVVALVCVLLGHMGASLAVLRDSAMSPGWVFVFHSAAAIMFGSAAFRYIQRGASDSVPAPAALGVHNPLTHSFWFHLGNAVVPYTIAMSAATLLFIRAIESDESTFGAQLSLLGALAFIGVGGLRHVLSHAENRSLYVHMSELNRSLEDLVQQRTRELVRRNEELEAVHKVATVSAESMDLGSVLHAVAEQLTHVVGASTCMIHERTADGLRVAARFERGGMPTTSRLRDPGVNLLQLPRSDFRPMGQRSSVIMRWELDENDAAAAILDYHAASVALVVPMVARDQIVGIAEIYRTSAEPFTEGDVSLVEAVTTQAALATENARAFDHVSFAASHDPVTGLLNHRALHEELDRLFEVALKTGQPMTVVMMDLNLFKEFNDRFGHQAGDAVLNDIGNAITASVPSSSVTARYGGDEFTVVIPNFASADTQIFVSAIRERVSSIEERYGFVGDGFGIAAGIASYPEDGANLNELVARADQRMYQDKRRLKGHVVRDSGGSLAPEEPGRIAAVSIDSDL